MKNPALVLASIEKACFLVFAHAMSRLRRRDISVELHRLRGLSKRRSYLEVIGFLGTLFALSLAAASVGWMALGVFFLAVLIVFY